MTGYAVVVGAAVGGVAIGEAFGAAAAEKFILNGLIGEFGYTGSVLVENCLGDGCSLEGWNFADGVSSYITGGATGLIPGQTWVWSSLRGGIQNGGGYMLVH
jgi:hypothetical protein